MGSATSSLDSQWRRFSSEAAARKSNRRRIGAFLPDLFNVRYNYPCFRETVRVILLCQLVHLYALLLGPANFELRFMIDSVSLKTIVNSIVMFFLSVNSFAASRPRVEGYIVLFLYFGFAMSSTMVTGLLDHVMRDRESLQS